MIPMAEMFKLMTDLFLNIDQNLAMVVANFGVWSYALLFPIIFMETGIGGDTVPARRFADFRRGGIGGGWIIFGLVVVHFVNGGGYYWRHGELWIGHYVGPKVFEGNHRLLKKEYLHKAQAFYAKHGGAAIVLARFVPIVRTFAPFVAGVGKMNYSQFIYYNIMGGAFG